MDTHTAVPLGLVFDIAFLCDRLQMGYLLSLKYFK